MKKIITPWYCRKKCLKSLENIRFSLFFSDASAKRFFLENFLLKNTFQPQCRLLKVFKKKCSACV